MANESLNRRKFIKKSLAGAAGLSLAMPAYSYSRIIGANDRLNFAVAGINSRGRAHIAAIQSVKNAVLTHLCDVDSRTFDKVGKGLKKNNIPMPKTVEDFRNLLDDKEVDIVTVATPDHWHAPMGLMGLQAGKHVYLEKPASHNPREGELLVAAQMKYPELRMQLGNQQRSALTSIQAMKDIKDGIIGDVYYGKSWYSNKRGPIGNGKVDSIPEWLNWELWQGPAPRVNFRDNLVHYNWHWFWHWGTGEISNNGMHEMDICRWALGVDYPTKVTSSGGRYHYNDDWEFYDTQIASFEFEGGKMLTWEGKSCNNYRFFDRGRGATIHGTKGSIMLDRNGYFAYDQGGKVIKEMKEGAVSATTDTLGRGGLDDLHFNNFANAIRLGEPLHSPIEEGHKSTLLCHLGNIAQETGQTLEVDPKTGMVINNPAAMRMWSREYEAGWEPAV